MSQTGIATRPLLSRSSTNTLDHAHIAYRFVPSPSPSSPPSPAAETTLLYLPGLKSTFNGLKGQILETTALDLGINYLTLNYQGHGTSSGVIKEISSLEEWLLDIEAVLLESLPKTSRNSSLIVVGSSLGGWLALLLVSFLTKQQTPPIVGLVLVAPAVDASQRWNSKNSSNQVDTTTEKDSLVSILSEYVDEGCIQLSRQLIDDANERWCILASSTSSPTPKHSSASPRTSTSKNNTNTSLLDTIRQKLMDNSLAIDIIAGAKDSVVPLAAVEAVAEALPGSNLHVVQNGDHRLSSPSDLELLVEVVKNHVKRKEAT